MSIITVERKILQKNDEIASELRDMFKANNLVTFNLLSSPGSGKTSILERTIDLLKSKINIGVVEGDVQTDNDAQRIAAHNVPVVQIVTNGGCHLDANLVKNAVGNLDLSSLDMLFIENVGNLVCPASYDLGEDLKIVIVSTTEGDDKPLKYPKMFRVSQICILNKTDLLPYVEFDPNTFKQNALKINPKLEFFELSAKTGEGFDKWTTWVESQVNI